MAGLAIASTAFSLNEANNQASYQSKVAKQNAESANRANDANYKLQNRQMNMQQLQESEAAALAKQQQQMAVQKEVATQRTSSGESGVSGLSIDSLFSDIVRQGSNNMTTIDRNLADSNEQRDVQKEALRNGTWANIQSGASYKGGNKMLGAGLQIAGAGLGAYTDAGGKLPSFGGGSGSVHRTSVRGGKSYSGARI